MTIRRQSGERGFHAGEPGGIDRTRRRGDALGADPPPLPQASPQADGAITPGHDPTSGVASAGGR